MFLNSAREVDPSGAFSGGILRLHAEEDEGSYLDVQPKEGTLVAFAASRLHEVTLVESGTRDAAVDWFY